MLTAVSLQVEVCSSVKEWDALALPNPGRAEHWFKNCSRHAKVFMPILSPKFCQSGRNFVGNDQTCELTYLASQDNMAILPIRWQLPASEVNEQAPPEAEGALLHGQHPFLSSVFSGVSTVPSGSVCAAMHTFAAS